MPFPMTYVEFKELIYMRSWQASGLLVFYYYFMLILGLFYFISSIVWQTKYHGVGGFFLGLLYGSLRLLLCWFIARLSTEVMLSILCIRDGIYSKTVQQPASASATSSSSAPSNNNNNNYNTIGVDLNKQQTSNQQSNYQVESYNSNL
ncbi:hypothetical protein SAMD00019534_100880, partial [Acytostelium subglobosum LB1]|uniref:hypothetical protein n=1 Tax=Acytostelium subglobosum LB1 TaxID=1410327 RepID=UPI0006450D6E